MVLLILTGAVVFALISNFSKGDSKVVKEGEQAPNFQLKTINVEEETLALNDFKGKGVMLNFWATYCPPCKEEMPYMEKLYPKYKEQGVEILAVSLDSTKLVIDKFLNEYKLTFPILHDKSGQVMDLYRIGPIPTTFFINASGEVVRKVEGPLTLEKLDEYLSEIKPKQ